MKQLIKSFGDSIVGVTSGFDRIVFQGMIRPLMYPEGAMGFFRRRRIRFARSSTPLRSVFDLVTIRKRKRRRSVRALEPTGKDLDLLTAIADPRFTVGGFCNKQLRQLLEHTVRYVGKTDKQRSGITTRSIRLLRDHGVIRRLPKARRYQLTARGRQLVTALLAALAASTEQLASMAA